MTNCVLKFAHTHVKATYYAYVASSTRRISITLPQGITQIILSSSYGYRFSDCQVNAISLNFGRIPEISRHSCQRHIIIFFEQNI